MRIWKSPLTGHLIIFYTLIASSASAETCLAPPRPFAPNDPALAREFRTLRHEAVDDHGQQAPRHRARLPAGAIKELMVAREVFRLGAPSHPQAGADGALARGQHGPHDQDEHVLSTGSREARAQRLQPIAQDLGNRIARRRRQ